MIAAVSSSTSSLAATRNSRGPARRGIDVVSDELMPSLRFRKEERLTRPSDFKPVFDRRCSVSDGLLIVYGLLNERPYCRLGLSVSRKVGSAVRRNRLRRLYREAFRLERQDLPIGLDLVLVPRGST